MDNLYNKQLFSLNKDPNIHYKKFGLQRRLKVVADALKVAANVICSDNVAANSGCVCSVAVGFSAAIFSRR